MILRLIDISLFLHNFLPLVVCVVMSCLRSRRYADVHQLRQRSANDADPDVVHGGQAAGPGHHHRGRGHPSRPRSVLWFLLYWPGVYITRAGPVHNDGPFSVVK